MTNEHITKQQIAEAISAERELWAKVNATRPAYRAIETPEYLEAYETWRKASKALDQLEADYQIQRRAMRQGGN